MLLPPSVRRGKRTSSVAAVYIDPLRDDSDADKLILYGVRLGRNCSSAISISLSVDPIEIFRPETTVWLPTEISMSRKVPFGEMAETLPPKKGSPIRFDTVASMRKLPTVSLAR